MSQQGSKIKQKLNSCIIPETRMLVHFVFAQQYTWEWMIGGEEEYTSLTDV